MSQLPEGSAGVYWQRVSGRRLKLSDEAEVYRQEHRGQLWYVVRDRIGDRYYRFGPNVYATLRLLDGTRTVDEAYKLARERFGDDAPTELELIKLFWRLHAADLLRGDVVGRTEESVLRAEKMERQRWLMQFRSPLAIRIALVDPSLALQRLTWLARVIFSAPAFLVWCVTVAFALTEIGLNWTELTGNFADRVLSYDNLLLMWILFPIIKIFHEFGHGLALRRWGCNTHEMGVMFLVFMPVPYVDASSSVVMTRPSERAAVGAAGLYVELFIAAVATLFWVHLEPGLARAICFNVILLAGASAVLFNGNPLLKFDAYYVLSDLLEIPNLGTRSSQWWLAKIQSKILCIPDVEDPTEAPGEGKWLALYAPLSLCYRLFLISAIALFVAKQAFFLGTILAVIAVFNVLVYPLLRGVRFLATSSRLKNRRSRAILRTGAVFGTAALVFFAIPVPYRTVSEGVVWYSSGSELRPAASGAVIAFERSSGDKVRRGQPILELEDPETKAEVQGLEARLAALDAQYRRELATDRPKAILTVQEMNYIRERIDAARDRLTQLTLISPDDGTLVIPRQRDYEAGWIGRGMPIGHVVGDAPMIVIAALRQADMELVTNRLRDVEVRFASRLGSRYEAHLTRVNPHATDELPSELFAAQGGGPFSLRQNAPGETGLHTIETLFLLEIALEQGMGGQFGERAYVLFDHGYSPLAAQIGRSLRQLFLREFEV